MEPNYSPRRRRIHYGRVLSALAIVILLIAAAVLISKQLKKDEAAQTMTEPSETQAAVPVETISVDNVNATEEIEAEETEGTTEAVPVPDEIMLEVPYITQEGLLPTGCELVSAKMVLEYYGVDVTIGKIIENTNCVFPETVDGRTYAPHPENAFIGSPWDESSFGCYSPVITDMMNKLLPEEKTAKEIRGEELQTLAEVYLPRNMPVLVWATINMLEHYPNVGWYLLDEEGNPTEEWYDWQANEHCLVLVGYDSSYYYFNDPYKNKGTIAYDRELAESRYNSIGQYAVIVADK